MRKSGFVAIAGRPNAGKSTLLNRILGTNVSIVTPKAQTTRERVLGILTEPEGQIVFVDTPGIHRAKEGGLNAYMVHEAREALDGTSAVLYLVDPHSGLEHEQAVLEILPAAGKTPIILLVNKADVRNTEKHTPAKISEFVTALEAAIREKGLNLEKVFRISARKGEGVPELMKFVWNLIPEGEFHYPDEDQISDRPVRFFVGEKIREQLLMQLGEEVPYSCAVEIERFDENAQPPRIEAIIYVERESQKGIVIGAGASKIKAIGQAARQEVEKFLGHTVFLGLRVKLLKDWTKDAETLKRLGYNLPPAPGEKKSSKKKPRSA